MSKLALDHEKKKQQHTKQSRKEGTLSKRSSLKVMNVAEMLLRGPRKMSARIELLNEIN